MNDMHSKCHIICPNNGIMSHNLKTNLDRSFPARGGQLILVEVVNTITPIESNVLHAHYLLESSS